MVRDTAAASAHLHIDSCYEDSEASIGLESMKRPLIATTRSGNPSLEAEEQTRLQNDKEQQDNSLAWKAFLIGSTFGCVQQTAGIAISCAIIKTWGQNPTVSSGAMNVAVHHWTPSMAMLTQVSAAIFTGILFTCLHSRSKSGSLCMSKKLDQAEEEDVDALSRTWTARMWFLVGMVCAWAIVQGGTCLLWIYVDLREDVAVPFLMDFLLVSAVFYFVTFCILVQHEA
jgi:hypothetical protein